MLFWSLTTIKQLYKDNENLKNQLNFSFLANNVKGLQSTTNRLKLFRFYKNKKSPKGILFLQQIQSSIETEKEWIDDFNDRIYSSHSKTNLFSILRAIYGNLNICVKNNDNNNGDTVLVVAISL